MINSVYGKTMENLRKRINVRVVSNEKDYLKHVSKPTLISRKIFDKNYAAIHEIKQVFGFTVLKFSKCLIYDFHYIIIKNILMLNCYLLTQTVLLMK